MNVPDICKNNSPIAILVVFLNKNNIPIVTSHHPMMCTQTLGSIKGSHETVASTIGIAGDRPRGLRIPNQKKDYSKRNSYCWNTPYFHMLCNALIHFFKF